MNLARENQTGHWIVLNRPVSLINRGRPVQINRATSLQPCLDETYLMSQPQGYRPDSQRMMLRKITKFIANALQISGSTLYGNVLLQQVDQFCTVSNPIDPDKVLKFRAGHERLYWRIKKTPLLEVDTNRWIANFNRDDVFIDIGSNIGLYSLMAAQTVGTTVLSFEMDPLNYALQHENIFLNNLQDRVMLFPFALTKTVGQFDVYFKSISPGDALHSLHAPSPYIATENLDNVMKSKAIGISLDFLYSHVKLPAPTHLKLDVDGNELAILEGSVNTLCGVKSIMIEVSPHSEAAVAAFMSELGFRQHHLFATPSVSRSDLSYNCLYVK